MTCSSSDYSLISEPKVEFSKLLLNHIVCLQLPEHPADHQQDHGGEGDVPHDQRQA